MESGVTSGGKKICLSDQGGKGGGGAGSLGIERDPLCLHHDRGEIKGSLLARRWNGDGVLVGGEVSCESVFGGEVRRGGGGMGLVTRVDCGYLSAARLECFVDTTRYDAKISMLRDTVLG